MLHGLALLLAGTPAHAFCGVYVAKAGADIFNNVSEVAIVRQGDRTTMSVSNDFSGDARDFALVVPVPEVLGEDDVRTIARSDFDRLDAYSAPRLVEYSCCDFVPERGGTGAVDGADGTGGTSGEYGVNVEEAFVVGEYDVVVLSATESSGLLGWLRDGGYTVPSAAEQMLQEYIDGGSYFFAAKVRADAGVRPGDLLSPLRFSYDSRVFGLPIRIGTASAKEVQDLVVYTLTDPYEVGTVGISNYPQELVPSDCMVRPLAGFDDTRLVAVTYEQAFTRAMDREPGAAWVMEYAWDSGKCDPCVGEPPDQQLLSNLGWQFREAGGQFPSFTRLHMRYAPGEATQDLVFYGSYPQNTQIRYIRYVEALESRFPICGEGTPDDPASCADVREAGLECHQDLSEAGARSGDCSMSCVEDCGGRKDSSGDSGWAVSALLLGGLWQRRRRDPEADG